MYCSNCYKHFTQIFRSSSSSTFHVLCANVASIRWGNVHSISCKLASHHIRRISISASFSYRISSKRNGAHTRPYLALWILCKKTRCGEFFVLEQIKKMKELTIASYDLIANEAQIAEQLVIMCFAICQTTLLVVTMA